MMTPEEIFFAIDDPQTHYKRYRVAECFAKLAQVEDKNQLLNQLESIAATLRLNEKGMLEGINQEGIALLNNDTAKTYFKERLQITQHPDTISRYGHLLWQFHKDYPGYKAAIAAYLQIATEALALVSGKEKVYRRWSDAIQPILVLSSSTKDQASFDQAVVLVNRLLSLPLPLWMKGRTLDPILSNLKSKAKQFDLDVYIREILNETCDGGYSSNKENFETAIKAESVLGNERQDILYEKKGDVIRAHALKRTNDPMRIVILPQLAEAMDCYKKAKAGDKLLKTSAEYLNMKKTRKVSSVKVNLLDGETGKLLYNYIESQINGYLHNPIDELLPILATDPHLLPWDGGPDEPGIYDDFAKHTQLVNFDINQNPKILSKAGSDRLSKAWGYKMKYKLFTQQYISGIMYELIKKGKLSIAVLDAFFEKTWICKTELYTNSENSEDSVNLYDALRPAFLYYLEQAGRSIRGEEADFMLCIDALVLKYEMLIRYFLQNCGIATTVIDSVSRDPRENFLPELLEKMPVDKFDEKDKMLMRHIYTKQGLDLRNNVAHGYLAPKSYTLELADTVVWSIIRLGQYTATDQLEI